MRAVAREDLLLAAVVLLVVAVARLLVRVVRVVVVLPRAIAEGLRVVRVLGVLVLHLVLKALRCRRFLVRRFLES